MTEVRQDRRGLYVMVEGQRARPGTVPEYAQGRRMDAGAVRAGQRVRAALLPDLPLVRVRAGGEELHWCTRASAVAAAPALPPYAAGQRWRRGGGNVVIVNIVNADGSMTSTGGVRYGADHRHYRDPNNLGRSLCELLQEPSQGYSYRVGQEYRDREGLAVKIIEVLPSTNKAYSQGYRAIGATSSGGRYYYGPRGEFTQPDNPDRGASRHDLAAYVG